MSCNSEIQEREINSTSISSLKRKREGDDLYVARKKDSDFQTLSKDIGTNTFRWITLQNGDAKAFWYFPSLRFEIDNNKKSLMFSEWFCTGNRDKWKVVLWPCKTPQSVGLYVQMDLDENNFTYKKSANVYMEAYFTVNSKLERKVNQSFSETFSFSRIDWGYDNFLNTSEHLQYLNKPTIIEITISPQKPHEDSKLITGYNGITNQGTTCYMNSLLQTLYFLADFRKAVYMMPTSLKDTDRLPLSLQLIFYNLQFGCTPACTRDLLTSFGWSPAQWSTQHDVQEFNCVLSDTLEKKMKGTAAEGTYNKLFGGKMKNYIECINVDYKSMKIECFQDLQLNVKGCKDIYESFDKYIEVEYMTGNDKYDAEGFGLQDAKKGVIFEELPNVLQLQLKRFEYDAMQDAMVKLNQAYEFYEKIDLNKYVNANGKNYEYSLFSILVHKGNATTGHYYSFISPKLDGKWFIFNDDSVDKTLPSQALEGNFGGEICELEVNEATFTRKIYSKNEASAYMLVYVKSDMKHIILQEVKKNDIPNSLHEIFESEQQSKEEFLKNKVMKESSAQVFLVSNEIVLGWDKAGISPPDNETYTSERFSICKQARCVKMMKKTSKGKDLHELIRGYAKDLFKLWVYTPGFRNWNFTELDLNKPLIREVANKAVFIQIDQVLFEQVNGEWKFIEASPDSPCSQGTEIIDEIYEKYRKVFLIFKWYDWENGFPKLEVIKAQCYTNMKSIMDARIEIFSLKFQIPMQRPNNLILHHEKSKTNVYDKTGFDVEIESFGPGENYDIDIAPIQNSISRSIEINNGDVFIGEIQPDVIPENYVNAKQWIAGLVANITVQCGYYDKIEKFGFKSYSRKIITSQNTPPVIRIESKLSYTQKDFMKQLADRFSIEEKINYDQIQLYYWEENIAYPTPLDFPDTIDRNKPMSVLVNTTKMILFDILPFSIPVINSKLLIHLAYVDSKFQVKKTFCKILEKNACISHLDVSIQPEMMEIYCENAFSSVVYYLLNHPQFAIIKELEMNQGLEAYCNNPNYYICFQSIDKFEQEASEGKVRSI